MIEVVWHGRGGQGAFTAARLLGAAASLADGRFALAFPSFGPERRGAPMRAFTKMDEVPIGDRSASTQADFVVYLDDTLLGDDWKSEVKPGGLVLVNSTQAYDDERLVAVDADGVSAAVLGRAIPNTAFLGVLAALSDRVDIEEVREAVRLYMPEKLRAKNIAIVDATYAQFAVARGCTAGERGRVRGGEGDRVRAGSTDADDVQHEGVVAGDGFLREGSPGGPQDASGAGVLPAGRGSASKGRSASRAAGVRIPTLRFGSLDPGYARTTCFEAGYLVAKNAGWRSWRPVIDVAACTGCLQCYLYCPDGAIFKASAADRGAAMPAASSAAEGGAPSTSALAAEGVVSSAAAEGGAPLSAKGVVSSSAKDDASDLDGPSALPQTSATEAASDVIFDSVVLVDYDFCKGCGICVKACRFGALSLVPERHEQCGESEVAR